MTQSGSIKRVTMRRVKAHGERGRVHVITPARASVIQKRLGIHTAQFSNILRAFQDVGVKV